MPDITSELTPIAADLIAGISTSMNDREPSAACPQLQIVYIPAGREAERKCCVHFAFQTLEGEKRREFRGFSSENSVDQIKRVGIV